jgi:Uma2 family endonuclease
MAVQSKTYTIEEFQEFEALSENAGHILELVDEEIIEKMPSFTPSRIGSRIGRFIGNFVDANDLGYVTGADGGYVISPGNPIWQLR